MVSAREVVAQTLAQMRPGDPDTADVVLAALREYWISEGQVTRIWFVVREDSWTVPNEIRAVIAALFEEEQ